MKTYYHLLLDRSGSMARCIEETIEGINMQINRIKEVSVLFPSQEIITSLSLFGNNITPVWKNLQAGKLHELDFSDYRTEKSTALLDAIGFTISEIRDSEGAEIASGAASAVIVIITDGYDNASRYFSHEQISSLIRELETKGGWTFSFIGFTFDFLDIASRLSIKKDNTMRIDFRDTLTAHEILSDSLHACVKGKSAGSSPGVSLGKED